MIIEKNPELENFTWPEELYRKVLVGVLMLSLSFLFIPFVGYLSYLLW